jgi:hypothetical protein
LQRYAVTTRHQTPFNPTRRVVQISSLQVNDPLVHYTAEDLVDPRQSNIVQVIKPPQGSPPASNLGRMNDRYRPWGGNPNKDVLNDTTAYDLSLKDPMIRKSDDWQFPTNKFPTIGWLGYVHRGTPWQTVYLKSSVASPNQWTSWAGRPETHPTNDWRMLELFTVAFNENASRGLLSVNQTNLAAWSALLSGVTVLSNTVAATLSGTNRAAQYATLTIEPSSWQLAGSGTLQPTGIVAGIIRTRAQQFGQAFQHLGDILATPELTVNSPYLNRGTPVAGTVSENQKYGITDAMYERIPIQILSLLHEDVPSIVVYAFGQSLSPAPNSRILGGLCTNYVITSEVATKTVVRFQDILTQPRERVESFNFLSSE